MSAQLSGVLGTCDISTLNTEIHRYSIRPLILILILICVVEERGTPSTRQTMKPVS